VENRLNGIENSGRFGAVFFKLKLNRLLVYRTLLIFLLLYCAVQSGRELWHVKLTIKSSTSASGSLCVNTEVQRKSSSSAFLVTYI